MIELAPAADIERFVQNHLDAAGAPGATLALTIDGEPWTAGIGHADPERWTRYGKKKPADYRDLQVKNPHRGCAISHAGTGSHVTVAVLEQP